MRRIILAVMSNVQGKLQIMSDLFHLEPSKQQTNKTNRTNMDSWKSENFDLLVAIKERKISISPMSLRFIFWVP